MIAFKLLAPTLWAAFQGSAPLTVDEAYKIAEANAFNLRISRSDIEKSRIRVNEARGRLGPRVSVDSTYTRFTDEIKAGGSVVRPFDQAQTQLVASMPLDVTGILKKGLRASESSIRVAEENHNADRNDLRYAVRAAFYAVLQAKAQVKVFEDSMASAQKRYRNTELEFQQGAKARVDVLRFQTQMQQAESDLIAAKNAEVLARNAFNHTLGRPIETPFELVEAAPMSPVTADEKALVDTAKANRPELKAFRANQEVLRLVRLAESGGLAPSLNVAAIHSRDWNPVGSGKDSTTFGQVTLAIPIHDSGVTRSRVNQAKQDEEQNRIRIEQLELGISLEVRQALASLTNAKARWDAAQKQVEYAAETFRLANIRYEAGEGILLEITDAQTELTLARTALVTATYDFLTSYSQLQRALGTDMPVSRSASSLPEKEIQK